MRNADIYANHREIVATTRGDPGYLVHVGVHRAHDGTGYMVQITRELDDVEDSVGDFEKKIIAEGPLEEVRKGFLRLRRHVGSLVLDGASMKQMVDFALSDLRKRRDDEARSDRWRESLEEDTEEEQAPKADFTTGGGSFSSLWAVFGLGFYFGVMGALLVSESSTTFGL